MLEAVKSVFECWDSRAMPEIASSVLFPDFDKGVIRNGLFLEERVGIRLPF